MKLLYIDFYMPYLFNDNQYPVGGATVEWFSWISGLLANNQKVGLLTWKGAKNFIKNNPGVDIIESYDLSKGIPKFRWLYYRLPSLFKAIKSYKPDYIFQECAGSDTGIMALIAKILKIPFVYRVANDIDTDNRIFKKLPFHQKFLYNYGLKNTNLILCQNSYQYNNLKKRFPEKSIYILYNPFNIESINFHIETNNSIEKKYIAWLGIFQYQKNLPALLEIVKLLPEVKFKIAGKSINAKLDHETKEAINGLKKCKNVEFVGYLTRKQVAPFLKSAYALLNTSHYEGFSNTFLEALSVGTPIVTFDRNDPDKIISKNHIGNTGNDIKTLVKILLYFINYKNFQLISKNCQQYLLDNHNPKILSEKLINILKKEFN